MSMIALIYVHHGTVAAHKQIELCLAYALAKGWGISYVRPGAWREAVRLIREGRARVLLMAYLDDQSREIVRAVEEVGGSVELCHAGHAAGRPPLTGETLGGHDTGEIVLRMHERGGTIEQIVRLLGVAEGRVRQILQGTRRRR